MAGAKENWPNEPSIWVLSPLSISRFRDWRWREVGERWEEGGSRGAKDASVGAGADCESTSTTSMAMGAFEVMV